MPGRWREPEAKRNVLTTRGNVGKGYVEGSSRALHCETAPSFTSRHDVNLVSCSIPLCFITSNLSFIKLLRDKVVKESRGGFVGKRLDFRK